MSDIEYSVITSDVIKILTVSLAADFKRGKQSTDNSRPGRPKHTAVDIKLR